MKEKLKCPGCGAKLVEVYAEATYGRVLLLEQCEGCGGVWFDRWELHFVKDAALKSLHEVDLSAFKSLANIEGIHGKNLCPKCEEELLPFIDPMLPKDATIKRCDRCSGLWLNRGDLRKYASHRETYRGASAKNGTAELATLKHLQKELKASELGKAAPVPEEPPIDTKELAKDVGFLALQTLLRMVFKI